jgi:Toprim-like
MGELVTKSQLFLPNRWGRGVEQFKVPCQIFQENILTLNPCAIKILLYLYQRAQGKNQQLQHKRPQREPGIPLEISQKELTEKTGPGIFQCFGCKTKGTTRKLLMKLKGLDEREGIEHYSRALGIEPVFHPPYPKAEAFYDYTDEYRESLYQVIRLPGKQFVVRHFTQGGWVYNLTGVTRTLYNRAGIFLLHNIVIVEGEKDADRVNALDLRDDQTREIQATTSGDANSWKDRHANLFERKNVTIMPDADEPGRGYQEAIAKSLESRNIPYRVLTLDGFKDVSEYLDAGHSRQDLENLIAKAWGWPTVDGRKTGDVILEGESSVWPRPFPNIYEIL